MGRSANAKTRNTSPIKTVKEHAVRRSTRATATATTTTTTVAAISMEATAVRVLSRAEKSKQVTANSASARIPSTLSKAAKLNARLQITLAMGTATTRTTTVPADTIKATAAVKMSKKPTARSANARTRNSRRPIKTVKEHAVRRSTWATATATTTTTTVAANSMEATAVWVLSRAERSTKPTARRANARTRNTRSNWICSF